MAGPVGVRHASYASELTRPRNASASDGNSAGPEGSGYAGDLTRPGESPEYANAPEITQRRPSQPYVETSGYA